MGLELNLKDLSGKAIVVVERAIAKADKNGDNKIDFNNQEEVTIFAKEIKEQYEKSNQVPKLIYKSHSITKRILLDLMDKDIAKIIVNNEMDYEEISKFLNEHECKIEVEKKVQDLKNMYDLNILF